jgi:16S rRNA (cytidine1402-2'-O)-methyltransferase
MAAETALYPAARRNPNGGCLYLISTPIGNLEDITLRALRILKEVDLVACEDTRETAKLLHRYGIHKRALSYHEHNEIVRAAEIMLELEDGARVALLSDAGTPGISDPGYHLVQLAIRHGIPVVPVPGPTALVAALAASGLPADHFHFVGFLPPKATQRRKALKALEAEPATLIFYEAPHRIADSLADMRAVLGDRRAVVAREVTKMHEEFLRGRLSELAQLAKRRTLKGESTVLVAPLDTEIPRKPVAIVRVRARRVDQSISARVAHLERRRGLDLKKALKVVARELGISRSEAYRRLQEERALD